MIIAVKSLAANDKLGLLAEKLKLEPILLDNKCIKVYSAVKERVWFCLIVRTESGKLIGEKTIL